MPGLHMCLKQMSPYCCLVVPRPISMGKSPGFDLIVRHGFINAYYHLIDGLLIMLHFSLIRPLAYSPSLQRCMHLVLIVVVNQSL